MWLTSLCIWKKIKFPLNVPLPSLEKMAQDSASEAAKLLLTASPAVPHLHLLE